MLANWCSLSTNSMQQSPFDTWSLRKWCLIFICVVLECMTEFIDKFIALVFSYFKGMWSRVTLKSSSYCFIQRLWAQWLPTAIYFASKVDNATVATCPFAGVRGEAHSAFSKGGKMRGVATNVYLRKTSEKPEKTRSTNF